MSALMPAHREMEMEGSDHPIIELRGLCKYYRQGSAILKAVDELDLKVNQGDFLLITGRSGSGKTTLLSLIGGLTAPTAGEISIQGENLAMMDDSRRSSLRARGIGFVFQFASLIPTLTAVDNVRLPGLFSGYHPGIHEVFDLLTWVGLAKKTGYYPSQLSSGQQTRVAVARALVNHPPLLLADEPTGNLDQETEKEIMELLVNINRVKGITILMVTHNPELGAFANRHIVMDNGRVHEAATQP